MSDNDSQPTKARIAGLILFLVSMAIAIAIACLLKYQRWYPWLNPNRIHFLPVFATIIPIFFAAKGWLQLVFGMRFRELKEKTESGTDKKLGCFVVLSLTPFLLIIIGFFSALGVFSYTGWRY